MLNSRDRVKTSGEILPRRMDTGSDAKPAWLHYAVRESTSPALCRAEPRPSTHPQHSPQSSPVPQQFVHTITRLSAAVPQPDLSKPGFLGCLQENVILRRGLHC